MHDWDKMTIDHPTSGGLTHRAGKLEDVYHIVHPQAASYILDEGRIRPGLIYDESKLNRSRMAVVWLSSNLWDGSIYGTVRFAFPWSKLIEGCHFYWVEAMGYRPPAYRILVTRNDHSSLGLTPYDPTKDRGPLRLLNGVWYWNMESTAEFMFDRDLALQECTRVAPQKHKEDGCRIYKSACRDLKTSTQDTAGWIVSHLLSHGIHSVDHTFTMQTAPGSPPTLHYIIEAGISGIFFALGLHNAGAHKGAVSSGSTATAIVKGALALLAAGQKEDAKTLASQLDSYQTFAHALQEIVDSHFGFTGWKLS